METTLAIVGLGIGLLVAIISFLIGAFIGPPPELKRTWLRAPLLAAGALVVIFFLLTLPTGDPFTPGMHLGWGFLIGGVMTLLAALGLLRIARPADGFWPYAPGFVFSLIVAAVSLVLLLFAGDPENALLGCALGSILVAAVLRLSVPLDDLAEYPTHLLEAGAVLAITLAAGSVLAVYHFDNPTVRGWWPYLAALAGFWLIGQAVGYIGSSQSALTKYPLLSFAIATILALAFTLVAGGILGTKLEPSLSLYLLLASGIISALLIVWLAIAAQREGLTFPRTLQAPALAVLLIIFLIVTSFKETAGFGSAVALLGAWAVIGVTLGLNSAGRLPLKALALGAGFLLLRVFLERTGAQASEVDTTLHYTLIGFLLGAVLPFVYSSFILRQGLPRALLLGAIGAISPLVLLALWGSDAVAGFLVGLIVAQGLNMLFTPFAQTTTEAAAWQQPITLMSLGMGLVAVQFSSAFALLYEMPRSAKVYIAIGIAAIALLWIIGVGLTRLRNRGRAGQEA